MNCKNCLRYAQALALGLVVLASATPSFALTTIELAAVETTWAPPGGGAAIPMWGFVTVGDAATYVCSTTAPVWGLGPQIDVLTPGDTLTINIKNCLTSDPVSVFIPGQAKATLPETFIDGQGRTRVKSFDADILAGASGSYTWNNVRAGTFLYHSGSHPQVAVQMGLYGVLTVGTYGYPEQAVVFSEIDPALHAAVDSGSYGTPAYPSTFDYYPEYFLINGAAYPDGADIGVTLGEDTLFRFVNAGLKNRVPTLQGLYMTLLAEDGFAYPEALQQYSVLLPPAKTIDAVLNVGGEGRFALYDRSLGLTNAGATGGGMLTYIVPGVFAGPIAVDDPAVAGAYTIAEDTVGGLIVAAPGVIGNDNPNTGVSAVLVSGPLSGTLTGGLLANGSFTYTPNANFNGGDFFTYMTNNGAANSNVATVNITVTAVNDAPVAVNDAYVAPQGIKSSFAAPGVLGNDADVDGDTLTASLVGAAPAGTLVFKPNGSFDYTPAGLAGAIETFGYQACDPSLACATATVSITVGPAAPNIAPTANDVNAQTTKSAVNVIIDITFNDVDPDGTIVDSTVIITSGPSTQRGGTVVSNGDGTVTYNPKKGFRGTDTFTYTVKDNRGATSNVATVRINFK
jgi:FtsP/CotA-like multicopper oxidase with cupredoxin domain